ncbi:MAG: RNA polymerase sigma factor [Planctomycetales bacterium]
MPPTDEQLVAAARQGDLASFGELYNRHYRLAVAIARSRLSDAHLAEDAAQESFATACRTLGTLQNGERFSQWLGTICRRTASRLAQGQPKHEPLSDDREPVNDSSLEMLREQVRDAVEQLDESSREIVLLYYFGGLSYDDIAGAVGLSTQAIHGRLQRARRKLEEILNATGAKK